MVFGITAPLAVWHVWAVGVFKFDSPAVFSHIFMAMYMVLLSIVAIYGLHRYLLIFLYYRHRHKRSVPADHFEKLPTVTIQLPMYNERYVVKRVIEAACAMEYPCRKLQIQVLDDSTDETSLIIQNCVTRMSRLGYNISYFHRKGRRGFKAGNLAAGLPHATGEFVAIFDADFLPEPDFLRRTIHYFTDPRVGLIQSRWGHINSDSSMLTRVQAMMLDGHFTIEHIARNRSGRFMSFNGTAGIWRRACIQDAGGWHCDTLTEDLDLSYRAQLRGWKFVYLPDMVSPAELPPEMNSFKTQQFRWTKGAVQTARKLLPTVLSAPLPLKVKIEAFFQLTNWVPYPCMALLTLFLFPAFFIKLNPFKNGAPSQILFDLTVFNLGTGSITIFYLLSQREIYQRWLGKIKLLPVLMSVGIGISLNNFKAVLEGFFAKKNEFVPTPKFGLDNASDRTWRALKPPLAGRKSKFMPYIELLFGFYLLACIVFSVFHFRQFTVSIPFLVIFAVGYFYVSLAGLYSTYASAIASGRKRRRTRASPAQPLEESLETYPETSAEPARLSVR